MLYSMNSCTGWIFVHISAFGVGGWVEVGKKQVLGELQLLKDFQKHKTLKLSISLENMQMYYKGCRVEGGVGAISNLKPSASESQTNALIAVMTKLVYLGKSSPLMVS